MIENALGKYLLLSTYYLLPITLTTMDFKIIDSHTHIQFPEYDLDRPDVIQRAFNNQIGIITAGADLESSVKAVDLANQYENGIWATVGVHPTEEYEDDIFDKISKLADNDKVVAIGECGLDFYRDKEKKTKGKQIELFEKHILLSKKIGKPLVIHCREAFVEVLEALNKNKDNLLGKPGILHFFTGNLDEAKILLDYNFSFTFGGLITYNRSFDEVIKFIPIKNILVETDAPFVSPKSHHGERNESSYILEVVSSIASIKNLDEKTVLETILSNTKDIFSLDFNS